MGEIHKNGVHQGDLVQFLKTVNTNAGTDKTTLDAALAGLDDLLHLANNYALGNADPVFAIDTNFDVKNTETTLFVAANVLYTLADNTSCNTGTTETITGGNWKAFVIDATNATTLTPTWTSTSYASEALALAAAKALPFSTGKARLGIVTIQAHASGFTAGTDALATGTGGNVAQATNYYGLVGKTIARLATTTVTSAPGTTTTDGVRV